MNKYQAELYHHGIKGQKWGVRRFQNPDGTLTEAGKKRYDGMSDEKLYKTLKKEFRNARAEKYGSGNRWDSKQGIGKAEADLRKEKDKLRKQYESSKEYKDWEKKFNELDRHWEDMDPDEYEEKLEKLTASKPKKGFDDLGFAYTYSGKGKEYFGDFVNRGGKELSIARLKDLGYSQEAAEDFVKRMARSGRTLGDI